MDRDTVGSGSEVVGRGGWGSRPVRWRLVGALLLSLGAAALAGTLAGAMAAVSGDARWPGMPGESISGDWERDLWHPAIAADSSGSLVAVWGMTGTKRNINYAVSDDDGITWSAPQVLSDTAGHSGLPDLVVADERFFVVWSDQDVPGGTAEVVYESEVGTGTVRVIPWPAGYVGMPSAPHVAAAPGRLHAVYNAEHDSSNTTCVLYSSRYLTATSWPTATVIHASTAALGSWHPVLAASPDGQILHLVWEDHATEGQSLRYMSGTVAAGGGVTWSPVITLSEQLTISYRVSLLVVPDGDLHVFWGETPSIARLIEEQYVRHLRWDAAGGSWGFPSARVDTRHVEVNANNPTFLEPDSVFRQVGGGVEICVAWHGFRGEVGERQAEGLLIACSPDGGQSWDPPRAVLASDEYTLLNPDVVFGVRDKLHVVLEGREPGAAALGAPTQIVHVQEAYLTFLPLVMRSH